MVQSRVLSCGAIAPDVLEKGFGQERAHNYTADSLAYVPQTADVRRICILYAIDYVAFALSVPPECTDLFSPLSTTSSKLVKVRRSVLAKD